MRGTNDEVVDIGVVIRDVGTEPGKLLDDRHGWGLPRVRDITLVGDTKNEDGRSAERDAILIEKFLHALHDISRHTRVDLLGKFDEPK